MEIWTVEYIFIGSFGKKIPGITNSDYGYYALTNYYSNNNTSWALFQPREYCTYRQLSISTATLYISAIIYHEISACARVRISSAAFSRAWVTFRFLELNEIRFSACYRFVARPVLLHLLLPPLVRRTFPRFEDPPTYSAPFLDVRGAVFSVMTSS